MTETPRLEGRIDLNRPRWEQDTYMGRAKHFFTITDPRNSVLSTTQLEAAKELLTLYRSKKEPAGTTDEVVFAAKKAYESAFHPDTKELMFLPGRMSFQVPGNMTICGFMLTFYKTTPAILFWQWVNQSFNAIVNYTNRSGDSDIPSSLLVKSYLAATTCAVGVAVGLNKATSKLPPLVGRLVPFTAVACANMVNIPMMRQSELYDGIDVVDESGEVIGKSKAAALSAIGQVTVSRIIMATPGMACIPVLVNFIDSKTTLLKKRPWIAAPMQTVFLGFVLTFATPMACALFEQNSSISVKSLESDLQDKLKARSTDVEYLFFNKGL